VGAGFSDQVLRSLPKILKPYVIREKHRLVETGMRADMWLEPVKVVEIAGAELTVSPVHTVAHHLLKRGGLALRFPRFVRFRDDKTVSKRQVCGKSTIFIVPKCREAKSEAIDREIARATRIDLRQFALREYALSTACSFQWRLSHGRSCKTTRKNREKTVRTRPCNAGVVAH
jgi:hypothetical protein